MYDLESEIYALRSEEYTGFHVVRIRELVK